MQSDQRVIEAYIGGDDEERGERVSAMLEVKDLEVSYGKIKAVKGITFNVEEGEVVTLIGTNGAGKTTTLRTISGLLRPAAGSITFQGKDLTTVAAHDIVAARAWRTPPRAGGSSRGSPSRRTCVLGAFARKDKGINARPRRGVRRCSRSSRSAAPSRPAPSPVASSRCWPWAGR